MGPRHGGRLTLVLLSLHLATGPALAETRRQANQHEFIYSDIAKEIGAPEMCAKIYPLAEHGLGNNPRGYQIYYVRSRCYCDVAVKTGNAKLCEEVRSLSTLFVDGSKISREECLKTMGHPEELFNASPGANFFDARPILTQMGYTKEMIPASIIRSNPDEGFMWHAFYTSLATTPDFRARLGRLTDYSRTAEAVSTVTCERHFIRAKRPFPPPDDVTCCPDFNDNGQCDDKESAANTLTMEDVAIEPVEGKPPGILCGDEPLRIEVRLRNNGLKTAHRSEGWVEIVNLNPLLFGLSKADLQIPIPEIPPGGEATVTFPPLKLVSPPDGRNSLRLDPRVLTAKGESYASFIDLHIEAETGDSPRCAAERVLRDNPASYGGPERRKSFGSAEKVYVKFPQEWPLVQIREGKPFEMKVEVRNRGTDPVAAGSGVVLLGGDDPRGFANRAADFIRPVPAVPAGGTATVSFARLVYRASPGAPHARYTQLTAALCMREGCTGVDYLGKEVLREGEAVIATAAVDPRLGPRVGDAAPDYNAVDLQGSSHRLMLLRERTHVVLVFIRGAASPACRRQLQEIQQHLAEFRKQKAEVFIISSDPRDALKAMRSDLGLDLTIVPDFHDQFATTFSRPESSSGTKPMVVIIDRHGLVRFKSIAKNDAARPTSAQLLAVLKELNVPPRR